MRILFCLPMLAACTAFDPPLPAREISVVTNQGEYVALCNSGDIETCAALVYVADELHTPEMNRAIAAAKPGRPR